MRGRIVPTRHPLRALHSGDSTLSARRHARCLFRRAAPGHAPADFGGVEQKAHSLAQDLPHSEGNHSIRTACLILA
jgi:hypothetical protein